MGGTVEDVTNLSPVDQVTAVKDRKSGKVFKGGGDEVIVFEPAYDSYVPAIELNGGKAVYITLKAPDYTIDWNEVRSKISSKTRLKVLTLTTGGRLSTTVTSALQVAVFSEPSVAVRVTLTGKAAMSAQANADLLRE